MSADDFEIRFRSHVDFMLQQQAQFDERVTRLEAVTERHSEQIGQLTAGLQMLGQKVDSIVSEMREGFNNLIVANEVTRDLAEKVGSLAVSSNQRLNNIEQRVSDLESKR